MHHFNFSSQCLLFVPFTIHNIYKFWNVCCCAALFLTKKINFIKLFYSFIYLITFLRLKKNEDKY